MKYYSRIPNLKIPGQMGTGEDSRHAIASQLLSISILDLKFPLLLRSHFCKNHYLPGLCVILSGLPVQRIQNQ